MNAEKLAVQLLMKKLTKLFGCKFQHLFQNISMKILKTTITSSPTLQRLSSTLQAKLEQNFESM